MTSEAQAELNKIIDFFQKRGDAQAPKKIRSELNKSDTNASDFFVGSGGENNMDSDLWCAEEAPVETFFPEASMSLLEAYGDDDFLKSNEPLAVFNRTVVSNSSVNFDFGVQQTTSTETECTSLLSTQQNNFYITQYNTVPTDPIQPTMVAIKSWQAKTLELQIRTNDLICAVHNAVALLGQTLASDVLSRQEVLNAFLSLQKVACMCKPHSNPEKLAEQLVEIKKNQGAINKIDL